MTYAGLPRDTPRFLADLAAGNSRPWFEANRARYETAWKAAGLDLLEALGPIAGGGRPRLEAVPKLNAGLKRIQRDIRFSSDKTPYAPVLHLVLPVAGDNARHRGMHLAIHPDRLGFGAGHYGLEGPDLARFRARVCDPGDRAALLAATARAEDAGSHWDAPDLKRVPPGFGAAPGWDHLLRRKSVIVRGEIAGLPDWLFTPAAPAELGRLIDAHRPLLAWLLRPQDG